jgi:hypothetical protein
MSEQQKRVTLNIPSYLTIGQYMAMSDYKGESKVGKLVHTVAALTGYEKSEVRQWDANSLVTIANKFAEIADHKNEFHSIIEWDGQLYGYAHMKQATIGEYMDLEKLASGLENNLHKVAAILYRPITKHKFESLEFKYKQAIKMLANKVENVFDWYSIEKYDADIRRDREDKFKQFPAHILLGAISFFLSTASLYLARIQYSENKITKETIEEMENLMLADLSENIGAGSGLFTTSLSPIYYQYQGTPA